jgi:excisionase family DNA binding protein
MIDDKFFENQADSWLSTDEVAKLLSVSTNSVRIMVYKGILPAYRLRRRLRFRKSDCLALVQKIGA